MIGKIEGLYLVLCLEALAGDAMLSNTRAPFQGDSLPNFFPRRPHEAFTNVAYYQ